MKQYLKYFIALFCIFLSIACSSSPNQWQQLDPIAEYVLDIPEPSGLSFGRDYKTLWVVSDAPDNRIYNISLTGETIQRLNFKGDDLEGISYDSLSNTLWIVEERRIEMVNVSLNSTVLARKSIALTNETNFGLEGIVIVNAENFWVTNEKNPGALFFLDKDFQITNQKTITQMKDYSGLSYNNKTSDLWVVSDESALLARWNQSDGTITRFSVPIEKAEGVAIDPINNLIYIVSDRSQKLYVFKADSL